MARKHTKKDISYRRNSGGKELSNEDDKEIRKEVNSLKIKYKLKRPNQVGVRVDFLEIHEEDDKE